MSQRIAAYELEAYLRADEWPYNFNVFDSDPLYTAFNRRDQTVITRGAGLASSAMQQAVCYMLYCQILWYFMMVSYGIVELPALSGTLCSIIWYVCDGIENSGEIS